MFMVADRLPAVREMILAENEEERVAALAKILPMQQADFEEIFTAMKGLPVTVRLLDPPLHEFLPNLVEQSLLVQKLELTGAPADQIAAERITLAQVNRLHEQNPMLGTRGCRLAMLYPSIPDMQARAIIKAALAVLEKEGETVGVEIMIPLVSFESELKAQRANRREGRRGGVREGGQVASVHDRHHDRDPACGTHRRSDRERGRLLLVRHERPHPDRHRHLA